MFRTFLAVVIWVCACDVEDGGDAEPRSGPWIYDETGATTNSCTFLENPSNGFGEFQLDVTGEGTLTILPNDQTEPFTCTFGDGTYECAERLTGRTDRIAGVDAIGNILVTVSGTIESETSVTGAQHGRIECEGTDCDATAASLGVTFPCSFTVPFTAEAV